MSELRAALGPVAPEVLAEFPGLRLMWMTVPAAPRASPEAIVRRLGELSNRFRGATAVALRTQPIPRAQRAFFRQIGLDPDVDRIPIEQAALKRLAHGGFRSQGLLADALLIALIETGVAVWALDAASLAPSGPGVRATRSGELLGAGPTAGHLQPGRLVVADGERVHALLFGPVADGSAVSSATERIALYAVAVDGVPDIHAEEALWTCQEVLASGVS